jgi:response regulator RpfG family c-di-GMP phosphodiesterase
VGDLQDLAREPEESPRILVVDDERVIREILSDFLSMEGYVVRAVEDGTAALRELQLRPYDLVISDLKMPQMGGIELLDQLTAKNIKVLAVIMTGFGTVETAIEAMKKGAYDYILKPFKVEEVVHVVQRGLDRQRLQAENIRLREALSIYRISEAVASSLDLNEILEVIVDAALDEAGADVVCLHLKHPKTGKFEAHTTRSHAEAPATGPEPGLVDTDELLQHHRGDKPLLAHGVKAARFFTRGQDGSSLVSFASVPMKVGDRIVGFLSAFSYTRGKQFDEGQRKMLSILGDRAAVSIENARLYEDIVGKNRALQLANLSLEENFRQTIVGFAHALDESDRYTRGHSERVAHYAMLIGRGMQLPEGEVETVRQAALMHDIGKIGIRYEKLNKPGKLTPEEVTMFRSHPAKGKRILEPIPFMQNLIPGCYCHHESWDGGGYPQGLMGEHIPVIGRIVAVADAYDAMTSDRSYRRALPHDVAVNELDRCSGAQFDPQIVDVFLREIARLRKEALAAGIEVPR